MNNDSNTSSAPPSFLKKATKSFRNLFRPHGNKYNPTKPSKFVKVTPSHNWRGGDK